MNEEISIHADHRRCPGCALLRLRGRRRRHQLRETFNVFDKRESTIAQALELMVESGELRPYVPGQLS